MKVFVTGASGFIGSGLVKELINNGHQVVALARSDKSAEQIKSMGADVIRGDLSDLEALKKGASTTDGVAHLGFIHNFADFVESVRVDKEAILAMSSALKGTNKPLIATFGTLSLPNDHPAVETDKSPREGYLGIRGVNEDILFEQVSHGVAAMSLRLTPTVHGEGDGAFIPLMIANARKNGRSPYVGDGTNVWPAVHRLDAASLVRLALEKPKAGVALHAVQDEGVPMKDIATAIGKGLNVPVISIPAGDEANAHFGFLGGLVPTNNPVSSAVTRKTFGWTPKQPNLLEDLAQEHYFAPGAGPKF